MAHAANWWERKQPDPTTPAVFVSHSSHDHSMADKVVRALESANLRCWIAPRDIPAGHSWASAIVGAIDVCPVLIVLLTERSAESPEVQREVELASNSGKRMLTVRLDPRAQLSGPLAYFLASIQWIDAIGRPLGPHLDPLLTTVQGFLGRPGGEPQKRTSRHRERNADDGRGTYSLDELLRRGPA